MPIPYRRPYQYHLNGLLHMLTVRKRVGPLPTHRLAVRHSVDHSSLDYFSPDGSARDSSLDSSSEGSLDFHSDASSDSFSRHSIPDHSSPDLLSTSTGPSRKRRRSPMTSIPALPHISRALSPVCADLIPSPKRVRDSCYLVDIKVDPRESSEPSSRQFYKPPLVISHHPKMSTSIIMLCRNNMPNTRSEAFMNRKEVAELVSCRVAEEMEARETTMNLEPLNESGDEQKGENEGNRENGNGNGGNGNGVNGEIEMKMERMEKMEMERMEKMEMKMEMEEGTKIEIMA
nr:hypothetical protein [Tanacetum cinerariifolium]